MTIRLALVTALAVLGITSSAGAETFTVSGTGDAPGATCAGSVCDTLRAAVTAANATTGSTIALGSGTYTLNGAGLPLTRDMTITGAGKTATTIDQTATADVLEVASAVADVAVSGLTVTGGRAQGQSQPVAVAPAHGATGGDAVGAIVDAGKLTLTQVAVVGNAATGGAGGGTSNPAPSGAGGGAVGGIAVTGSLVLDGSAVTGNTATGGAGGTSGGAAGAGGAATGGVLVEPGAAAVSISGSSVSNDKATGGHGGPSVGAPGAQSGAGGAAYGDLAVTGGTTIAVTGSTLDGAQAFGGVGGGQSIAATGGTGGAATGGLFATAGALSITDTSLDDDAATGGVGGSSSTTPGIGGLAAGGGLSAADPATVTIDRTSLGADDATGGSGGPQAGNSGKGADGGTALGGAALFTATATVVNTTIAKSVAAGGGGSAGTNGQTAGTPGSAIGGGLAVQAPASVRLASDTIADDAVQPIAGGAVFGGDLDDGGRPTKLSDTVIAGGAGSPTSSNCYISGVGFASLGHNLASDADAQCDLTDATDIAGKDAQLGQLVDHGGPGPTLAPAASSPLRGAGGTCVNPIQDPMTPPPLTVDERGNARHTPCDIGAYETQPPTVTHAPVLAAPLSVGTAASCPTDGFAGDAPLTLAVQWLRDGTAIAGATGASYTPVDADVGHSLSCSAGATNVYGSVSARSNAVALPTPAASPSPSPAPTATPGPSPVTRFAGATLRSKTLRAKGRKKLLVTITCPKATPGGRCVTAVTVLPAHGKHAVLGHAGATIAAGHAKRLTIHLRHRPVHVRVVVRSHDPAGAHASHTYKATVRA